MARSPLDVWLYGTKVATLSQDNRNRMRLEFTEEADDRFGPGSNVLSLAMPVDVRQRPNGRAVRAFFNGLLPEGPAREQLEEQFQTGRGNDFALLEAIGRDCLGAIILVPPNTPPEPPGSVQILSQQELARHIRELPERPLGVSEHIRISLPGVQPKLLLVRSPSGEWGLPLDGYPSTHILKPQDMRYHYYAASEAFCLRLARALGLTSIDSEVIEIDGIPCVVVSRYDRLVGIDGVERIHQEDAAQALSIDLSNRESKYEGRGGRSLRDVARLLTTTAARSDLHQLLRLTTFNVLVGNADGHAKNISFMHYKDGSISLAPAYDISPLTFYRQIPTSDGPKDHTDTLGMFVNKKRSINKLTVKDLVAEGISWGILPRDAEDLVNEVLETARIHISDAAVLSGIPEQMFDYVDDRRTTLTAGNEANYGERWNSTFLDEDSKPLPNPLHGTGIANTVIPNVTKVIDITPTTRNKSH